MMIYFFPFLNPLQHRLGMCVRGRGLPSYGWYGWISHFLRGTCHKEAVSSPIREPASLDDA